MTQAVRRVETAHDRALTGLKDGQVKADKDPIINQPAMINIQDSGLDPFHKAVTIETSTNLVQWTEWTNFVATLPCQLLPGPNEPSVSGRFYRAVVKSAHQ